MVSQVNFYNFYQPKNGYFFRNLKNSNFTFNFKLPNTEQQDTIIINPPLKPQIVKKSEARKMYYCQQVRKNVKIGKNNKGEYADIENLDEKTLKALLKIADYAKKLRYTTEVRTAKRSVEEQKRQLAHNPYAAKVENSHHVSGDAVDLHFYDKNGKKADLKIYYLIGELC